jgi:hypothetical protein
LLDVPHTVPLTVTSVAPTFFYLPVQEQSLNAYCEFATHFRGSIFVYEADAEKDIHTTPFIMPLPEVGHL